MPRPTTTNAQVNAIEVTGPIVYQRPPGEFDLHDEEVPIGWSSSLAAQLSVSTPRSSG
jgi:hypothetical protein